MPDFTQKASSNANGAKVVPNVKIHSKHSLAKQVARNSPYTTKPQNCHYTLPDSFTTFHFFVGNKAKKRDEFDEWQQTQMKLKIRKRREMEVRELIFRP